MAMQTANLLFGVLVLLCIFLPLGGGWIRAKYGINGYFAYIVFMLKILQGLNTAVDRAMFLG